MMISIDAPISDIRTMDQRLLVAGAASWIPARGAAAADPSAVLRDW